MEIAPILLKPFEALDIKYPIEGNEMTKRIFASIILVSFITFFCCTALILGAAYVYFKDSLTADPETEIETFGAFIISLLPLLIIVLAGVMIICVFVASSLAKKIVRPINAVDIENPDFDTTYKEIAPLIHRFSRQNDLIRRQMDDLKHRQDEFIAITESMAEGLILTDKRAGIVSCNKCALKILKGTEGSLSGNVCDLINDGDFSSAVEKALAGEGAEAEIKYSGRILQIFANPVITDDKALGAVIVILDITEKSKRDEMRREFTSNVSHELKTPLTSIYGISEMMMSGIVKPEDMKAFSENIHKETGRLIALINDIMKLSRLDEKAVEPGFEETDLYSACEAVKYSLDATAKEKNVSLSIEGDHLKVNAIPSLLSEMIYNLCDNAIKYNRDGGEVNIKIQNMNSRPAVCVSDTGIGIPDEHKDRIFERFYRVDKSHSGRIGGTGLGLSIVKHAAMVHNAEIKLESREGEGTAVTVIF